jgi:hypothetical protein
MPTYKLKIEKSSIDGTTGHHTADVYIIESSDDGQTLTPGIKERYGIESQALIRKFNGDINKWLAQIGQEMLAKHLSRTQIQTELLGMSGKMIDLNNS